MYIYTFHFRGKSQNSTEKGNCISRIAKHIPALSLSQENLFGLMSWIQRGAAASTRPSTLSALRSSANSCLMTAPLCAWSVSEWKQRPTWTWWLMITVLSVHQRPLSSQKFLMTSNPQITHTHILQSKISVGPGHQNVGTMLIWSFLILM